jgi:hypothetical protein
MMARSLKPSAKAERADHRQAPDERADRDAAEGLLPPEELDRPPASRLTLGDMKRAAAKAKGAMGVSKKLDPTLMAPHTRDHGASSTAADGMKKSRGAPAAGSGLDKGSGRTGGRDAGSATIRRTKSNAEIAAGVTSTARKSPAGRATSSVAAGGGEGARGDKRTGGSRQRVPAPGNVTSVSKRQAITGQPPAKVTGQRSTSSTGGPKPPKRTARAGQSRGAAKSKGADGNVTR